jgi:hypothetical protein
MNDTTRPAGPALADALGGTFDFDNGTVRFEERDYFVRCSITGRVHLVIFGGRAVILGRMSEGIDALRYEFLDALIAEGLDR